MLTLANDIVCMKHFDELDPILTILNKGGLILYPTDTTWSIGCDATNANAIDRIFDLKQRDKNKPFVVLVSSLEMLAKYVEHLHPRIETLLVYHQRPLTIIYDNAKNLPDSVQTQDGRVGIRLVQDPFCKAMIDAFGKPIISSAANIGAVPLPTHFGEISSAVITGVNYVVRHRRQDRNMEQPSVIARMMDDGSGELEFLRE